MSHACAPRLAPSFFSSSLKFSFSKSMLSLCWCYNHIDSENPQQQGNSDNCCTTQTASRNLCHIGHTRAHKHPQPSPVHLRHESALLVKVPPIPGPTSHIPTRTAYSHVSTASACVQHSHVVLAVALLLNFNSNLQCIRFRVWGWDLGFEVAKWTGRGQVPSCLSWPLRAAFCRAETEARW